MSEHFETVGVIVKHVGERGDFHTIMRMLQWFVGYSQYVEVTPLPDDEWELRFKPENQKRFEGYLNVVVPRAWRRSPA